MIKKWKTISNGLCTFKEKVSYIFLFIYLFHSSVSIVNISKTFIYIYKHFIHVIKKNKHKKIVTAVSLLLFVLKKLWEKTVLLSYFKYISRF